MTLPVLTYRPTADAGHVSVDLSKLIWSKLLIQAGSGYGKSWAVRQLCEETFGKIPQIVIDPEGEFHTLREKYDYVLAAPRGGDVEASVKTAAILARRLIELRASAVVDIFELKPGEQRRFVRIFLETLIGLPRSLWHPTLVILDEIQLFGPEKGHGEAESLDAVADFGTRARKRGFCMVGATTRLAKLHKDIAGNLNNKLIGNASLDIDIKRASAELGFDREHQATINKLDPGQFYAYGPAISKDVTLVRTGAVKTTHPEAGASVAVAAVPPSSRVKALIASSLADLPKEAEEEARTVEDLRRANADLAKRLRMAEKAAPAPVADPRAIARAVDDARRDYLRQVKSLRTALEAAMKFILNVSAANFDAAGVDKAELERAITAAVDKATQLVDQRLAARAKAIESLRLSAQRIAAQLQAALGDETTVIDVAVSKNEPFTVAPKSGPARPAPARERSATPTEGLSGVEQRILNTLAALSDMGVSPVDKGTAAALVGYHPNAKSYANALGSLRTSGRIAYPSPGVVSLTDDGRAVSQSQLSITTVEELHGVWYERLGNVARRILEPLIAAYPATVDRAALAEAAGYHPNAKSFANMIGKLRTLGLIDYPGTGKVVATNILFPEGLV